jgi:exopolysaccharide production protein ExoQ
MDPKLALFLSILFILWLFRQERKRHPGASTALWMPLLWLTILGSRPLSMWFGFGDGGDLESDPTEGSPFDRFVFLVLIAAGLVILARRGIGWSEVVGRNKWLFLFFLYLGISVIWSDYPFVSFKRWTKELGNIVMVLVVLTEADPIEATKALFERFGYLLVTLSLLFIKYFPDIGRAYTKSGESMWVGVTTNKNTLGMTVLVCGIGMMWSLLEPAQVKQGMKDKSQTFAQVVPILMTMWLLFIANSSTSLSCGLLGAIILLGTKVPTVRNRMASFGVFGGVTIVLLLLVGAMFNAGEAMVGAMGRDLTFTGRVDIWKAVLRESGNPLFGAGYYSFWLGDRVKRISEGYYYNLNEAHNGYLETYLDNGLVGLFLISAVLLAAAENIKKDLRFGNRCAGLKITFLVLAAIHNLTETSFSRLGPLWFALLFVITEYRGPSKSKVAVIRTETPDQPGNSANLLNERLPAY